MQSAGIFMKILLFEKRNRIFLLCFLSHDSTLDLLMTLQMQGVSFCRFLCDYMIESE